MKISLERINNFFVVCTEIEKDTFVYAKFDDESKARANFANKFALMNSISPTTKIILNNGRKIN